MNYIYKKSNRRLSSGEEFYCEFKERDQLRLTGSKHINPDWGLILGAERIRDNTLQWILPESAQENKTALDYILESL